MTDASLLSLRPAPAGGAARTILFAFRRMAIAGLDDAHAASALMGLFGLSYRRPLVLSRTLLAEIAAGADRPFVIAPPCCCRITADEDALLKAIADEGTVALPGHGGERAVTIAVALGKACADLGRPIDLAN